MHLVLATLCSSTFALGDPSALSAPVPLVVRSYDISAAVAWHASPRIGERVFPNLLDLVNDWGTQNVGDAEAWDPDPQQLMAFVQDFYAEEFQSAGRALWDDESGHLVVRAPEAVQRGVQELITAFESVLARPTEIAVDIVRQPDGAEPIASSMVAAADAERLLGAAGTSRASYVLRVPAGNIGWLDATTRQDLLVDYDVEIAQGAVQYDPIVTTIESGVRIEARCSPAPGGAWLALVLRDTLPIGGPREIALDSSGTVMTERGPSPVSSPSALQGLCAQTRALGLNTLLSEGKALLIQTSLGTRDSQGSTLVCLRLVGSAPPRQIEIAPQGLAPDRRGTLVNLQFAAPPRCYTLSSPNNDQQIDRVRNLRWRRHPEETLSIYSFLRIGDMGFVEQFLPENQTHGSFGPWVLLRPDPTQQPSSEFSTEDVATVLSRACPSARLFQLRLTLGRKGSSPIARACAPLRLGEASTLLLGTESTCIADYEVEVAQNASILDPTIGIAFEGLVVRAIPRAGVQGEPSLDLSVLASARRESARTFDARPRSVGSITEETTDELIAHERLFFGKPGAAPRALTLGDGAGSGLSLLVELDEVR